MKNKKVIVVGGSSGIGLTLASALVEKGADVVIASRDESKLSVAKQVLGGGVRTKVLDVASESMIIEFFENVGGFDHLVSTIKPDHLVSAFSLSNTNDARNAFDSKYWGQYYLTKHCLPYISKSGSITLTSGIASQRGYSGFSTTAAINGAVESFVKSVAGEIAPVRINSVCPGFIERDSHDQERQSAVLALGAKLPLDRLGAKEEVAEAYMYLMSNSYSTGTNLIVDGGELSA